MQADSVKWYYHEIKPRLPKITSKDFPLLQSRKQRYLNPTTDCPLGAQGFSRHKSQREADFLFQFLLAASLGSLNAGRLRD